MSDVRNSLEAAHREVASVAGQLSLALARRSLRMSAVVDYALTLRRAAETLESVARGAA